MNLLVDKLVVTRIKKPEETVFNNLSLYWVSSLMSSNENAFEAAHRVYYACCLLIFSGRRGQAAAPCVGSDRCPNVCVCVDRYLFGSPPLPSSTGRGLYAVLRQKGLMGKWSSLRCFHLVLRVKWLLRGREQGALCPPLCETPIGRK